MSYSPDNDRNIAHIPANGKVPTLSSEDFSCIIGVKMKNETVKNKIRQKQNYFFFLVIVYAPTPKAAVATAPSATAAMPKSPV